jgi:hypothetical protein
MDVGGRNEAARRRQSIALEKQRTYSTVENHINHVKHHKDREGSSKCENDVITEEHAGGIQVDIEDNKEEEGMLRITLHNRVARQTSRVQLRNMLSYGE